MTETLLIKGLFELGAFMRPKHEVALNQYMDENWKPLEQAIAAKDFAAFEKSFRAAVDAANAFHELKEKPDGEHSGVQRAAGAGQASDHDAWNDQLALNVTPLASLV